MKCKVYYEAFGDSQRDCCVYDAASIGARRELPMYRLPDGKWVMAYMPGVRVSNG